MRKKIFKTGDFTKEGKGKWTADTVKKAIEAIKEIPITVGHVGDWRENGIPRTAIPKAGVVKDFALEGDYLTAEVEYNEYGKTAVESGAYEKFSIGFNASGKADHLAILGYAPPFHKDLDNAFAFSDDSNNEIIYIDFEENIKEGGNKMTIEEILNALVGLTLDDKLKIIASIKQSITPEQKMNFRHIAMEFAEAVKEEVKPKTEDEIRTEIRAEFAAEEKRKTVVNEFLTANKEKITPAMEKLGFKEFCDELSKTSGEIEFAENDKSTMFVRLQKIFEAIPAITKAIPGSEFTETDEDEMTKAYNKGFKGGND
jgi:hypothetical protein